MGMVATWTPDLAGGPVRRIALPRFRGKLDRVLRSPWLTLRLALRARADVYHFHDPELLLVGCALKGLGKRVIYDVHEDYSQKFRSRGLPLGVGEIAARLFRLFESACAWWFDHMVTADSHVASLFPKKKTTVIANYPPLEFVREPHSHRLGAASKVLRLAYVGGISRARGIPQILRALDLLEEGVAELHIAGTCQDEALLELLRRHPRVVFHGVLPWERVSDLLRQADVGMLTLLPIPAFLYCPGENVIKLWEYLGMSLPVVVSNFPRLGALIEKLKVGITVDPEDPAAIAAAIRRLHGDPELRRRLGENGRMTVLNERNWEAEAVKLLAVYERLVPVRSEASGS